MIWILATRGASTKLRLTPFTETPIDGVHSVVYKPGIAPVPLSGNDMTEGPLGTFKRGPARLSGFVFSHDGDAAETLLAVQVGIDLIVRYRANRQKRMRTIKDVIFIGDATVMFPPLNRGESELIGVPFRAQIPEGDGIAAHVDDSVEG